MEDFIEIKTIGTNKHDCLKNGYIQRYNGTFDFVVMF